MGKNRMPNRAPGVKIPSSHPLADYSWGWDTMSAVQMMSKMDGKGWKSTGQDSKCGIGSNPSTTSNIRNGLPKMLKAIEAESMADVGAGDRKWAQHVHMPSPMHYAAFDLIPRHRIVEEFNCVEQVLPRMYDAILVRFVLNHLSARMVRDTLQNFIASGSKYLLCTYPDPNVKLSTKRKGQANQTKYWEEHGIVLPEPVYSFIDFGKWRMGAFELESIEYPDDPDTG